MAGRGGVDFVRLLVKPLQFQALLQPVVLLVPSSADGRLFRDQSVVVLLHTRQSWVRFEQLLAQIGHLLKSAMNVLNTVARNLTVKLTLRHAFGCRRADRRGS